MSRKSSWKPAEYSIYELNALKAVAKGEADPSQQKKALDWIINNASNRWEVPFFDDADGGDRNTAFACGRMFVGQQIIKLVNMSPDIVAKLTNKQGNPNG